MPPPRAPTGEAEAIAKKKRATENQIRADIARAEKIKAWARLINPNLRTIAVTGLIAYALYSINNYLSYPEENLNAVANILKQFHFGEVLPWLLAGTSVALAHRERKGKQRAIKEKSKFQKLYEADDAHRSSSKLTPIGTTPKEEDEEGD